MLMSITRFGKSAGELPQGIRSLEVHGTVNEAGNDHVVTANKDTILGRGTENYCHSIVESILEHRDVGYVVPEYWDQFWNYKLGAIWHPDSDLVDAGTTTVLWQKSEEIAESSSIPGNFSAWGNITAQNDPAYISNSSNNKFPYIDFDGTNDDIFLPNADIPAELTTADNKDFIFGMVLDLADQDAFTTILQINESSNAGSYRIRHDSRGSTNSFECRIRDTSSTSTGNLDVSSKNFSFTDTNIVMIGKINNEHFVRVNGNTAVTSSAIARGIVKGTTDLTIGCGYALGLNSGFTDMNLYEFLFLKSNGKNNAEFLDDIIKLEGALARKFDIVSVLPNSHTYKSHPPRVINI